MDWIKCGKGRDWGNCVLRTDCVEGLDEVWVGKGKERSRGIVF